MAQVAITGASGHVGACLVRQLLADGHEVRALVRTDAVPAALEGLRVERVTGNVCEPHTLRPLMEGAELVFHLAALISIAGPMQGRVRAVNVRGSRNVAAAAFDAGVRRMVHVSSVHAFSMNTGPLDGPPARVDESHPRVDACSSAPAYDASKASGEVEIRECVDRGLDAVIVHPSGVLGPFDFRRSRMGKVLRSIGRGRMPAIIGGGFDWVDVRDVCRSMRAAIERGRTGESYILAGHHVPMAELARAGAEVAGVRAPKLVVPLRVAGVFAPLAETLAKGARLDPLYTAESLNALRAPVRFDASKAHAELGHTARPLDDTLRDVYAWFTAHGQLPNARASLQPEVYGPVAAE